MCGICGELRLDNKINKNNKYYKLMLKELKHRGPDDEGEIFLRHIWLGHRRLSVIDLSPNGHQPMSNENNTIWLIFNGEIYNYKELKSFLKKAGHKFKSNTDSEVIIHLYEDKGEDFLKLLNGMFALGLYDVNKNRLILARDKLGVKPLIYYYDRKKLVFASEIKAILQHPEISRNINFEALELYFTYNFIPAPLTIYKNIFKLQEASYLIFDEIGLRIRKYWDIPSSINNNLNENEIANNLKVLVNDATKIRLYSDVPLGIFLSGGIDSSIVTASAALHYSKKLKTFSIGFPNTIFDETKYAKLISDKYDTEHNIIYIKSSDLLEILPDVLSFFDEPFADSSAVPTYLISKLTKESVTVALSGDGGDEIFGGYRRYLGEYYIDRYQRLPGFLRENIIKPIVKNLPDSKDRKLLEYIRRLKIFIEGATSNQYERHYMWQVYFPDKDRNEVFIPSIVKKFNNIGIEKIRELYDVFNGDRFNKMLFIDVKNLLPYDMLNKVDWMSMKNALEIRSPLLDYRITEFAFSINGNLKFKNGNLKYLLKNSFKDWLPREILDKPKQGFEIPIGKWLKESKKFKEMFWDVLNEKDIKEGGFFNYKKIEKLYKEHVENKRDNSHKLWALFVFQWWYLGDYGPI